MGKPKSDNPKISKSRANYRPSASDVENCRNCRLFLYDTTGNGKHGCQVVEGLINPSFVSDLFQPQVDFGENGVTPEAFPVAIGNPAVVSNPLKGGFGQETVSANISMLIGEGKEQERAVAISLDNARREFRKKHKRGRFPKHLREKNPPFAEHVAAGEPWAVEAAAKDKVKGLPSGSQILLTAPSNLTEVFDLPFRALKRAPGQSKRLVEIGVRAVEVADKVAFTNSHPSIKVIERLQELMTDEERREWAVQIQGLIPFHNKFIRERLVREAAPTKPTAPTKSKVPAVPIAAVNENYPPGVNPNDIPFTTAMQAHRGTSFVPDERGRGEQTQYVEHMKAVWQRLVAVANTAEQKKTAVEEFEKYRSNWASKYRTLLSARSGLVSTMITGPSGFNIRRAEKKNRSYDKKLTEFLAWDKRAQAKLREAVNPATARSISADRSDATEALQAKIDNAKKDQEQWKALNIIVKSKKLSDEAKIAQVMADFGFKQETAAKLLEKDFVGRIGIPAYMLTNNNSNIKRMEARIAEITTTRGMAPLETSFDGGRVVENADNNRLQILFDDKPSAEVRTRLKQNGFRWSPREGAWQRQRNQTARLALQRAIGVSFADAEPVREHEVEESIEFTPDSAEPPTGNRERNPSCPSCSKPFNNPSIAPGNYTCSGCGSNITVAKANPDLLPGTTLDETFGNAIIVGAGIATGSVIAQSVLNRKKR